MPSLTPRSLFSTVLALAAALVLLGGIVVWNSYRTAIGNTTLDLRHVPFGTGVYHVTASVAVGQLDPVHRMRQFRRIRSRTRPRRSWRLQSRKSMS